MNQTPEANIPHIALFGARNAGKSSLLNSIATQKVSLVSEHKGTTTDPVKKRMELIPIGPVVFIDTAGIDDEGDLGRLRVESSKKIMHRTDLALIIIDIVDFDLENLNYLKKECKKYNIPYKIIFNKIDLADNYLLNEIKEKYKDALFVSASANTGIFELKEYLINNLNDEKEDTILGDLVDYNSTVVLVVPIDSEAPKGRIILPQVQIIRDCLDHGIKSYVVRDTELASALKDLKQVDLVITDSQAFKDVAKIVPKNILLTSFSILFARHKGDIKEFLKGVQAIRNLNPKSKILISESCSHNVSHEDIGRFKIPKLLKSYLGFDVQIDHSMGHDFPENLLDYDLVIHCGSCMLNKKTMQTRIQIVKEVNVPITNYGVVLAFLNDILERSVEIFN